MAGTTIWVLGDQLNRALGPLAAAVSGRDRVLMVESTAKLASKHWHVQRAHLVIASMRRFADELRIEGFDVDQRTSTTLATGLADHRRAIRPDRVTAMEPASYDGLAMLHRNDVDVVRSNQFLCHYDEFASFAATCKTLKMEDFYRWQRRCRSSRRRG